MDGGEALGHTYLLTGGAGFVGATLARALLERGDDVVILDSGVAAGFANVEQTGAQLINADIRDRAALEAALDGCRGVVHLAAQVSVPDSIREPLETFEVNVRGSFEVLEAARLQRTQRVVFASSNAVIGGHTPPAREDLPPNPVSPYGAAKAATEAYLLAYRHAYGMETVTLRFANAYGPWSGHKNSVVAAFVRAYLRGGPLTINGDGHQTRDFVHVADLAQAIMLCLDAPAADIAGEVFQVGTGTETSLVDVAHMLFDVGGGVVPIDHRPSSVGDVARNVSDISRTQRVLGYEPRVALRDGLADTLRWFREHRPNQS